MTTNTNDRQLVWIVLAVLAAILVLPAFGMGFGMMGTGPMMGGMWDGGHLSGWMVVVGLGMQFLFLAVVVGTVYLAHRAMTGEESGDPALEELRSAYARGDLSDEAYERRRERLEDDQ